MLEEVPLSWEPLQLVSVSLHIVDRVEGDEGGVELTSDVLEEQKWNGLCCCLLAEQQAFLALGEGVEAGRGC